MAQGQSHPSSLPEVSENPHFLYLAADPQLKVMGSAKQGKTNNILSLEK
jgi:hypothetical protein